MSNWRPTTYNSYREHFGVWAQRNKQRTTAHDDQQTGPKVEGSLQWTSIIKVDGEIYGTGISKKKGDAHEAAAYWALVRLGEIPGPEPEAV
ncbi:hypothetical protein CYLTODRAFT_484969 [Cylindrobasidium torrendii FP15055 ss-10]|uniref:DRBM domain-containing protein n=1 Tax=Cylindrobasidium torrendii FP15055 ss-10 TaxID=1314674 RepID=A0A0D7BW22_9AGAR|nr:hypothetical protein CYLTODRAFT_484969 [Cylindrobasidium torrendii FP15055 ss-10]